MCNKESTYEWVHSGHDLPLTGQTGKKTQISLKENGSSKCNLNALNLLNHFIQKYTFVS